MFFFLAFVIIALACATITIRNLIWYGNFGPVMRTIVTTIVIIGWFGVIPLYGLKKYNLLPDGIYGVLHNTLYGMLAFMFILFVMLLFRDTFWLITFKIMKMLGKASWNWDPNNEQRLNQVNLVTVLLSMAICIYAGWQAKKLPDIAEINLYSDKITNNIKIVQVSDFDLSRRTSKEKVKDIIKQVNLLTPDVVVLTGDVIGDNIEKIIPLLQELREFSAPYGVYAVMGEQEFEHNVYAAKKNFEALGITFLFNGGVTIKPANVFISGIPDYSSMSERINLWRTIYKSKQGEYRVLLSHSPMIIDALSKELFDVVLSGHTHGGQFFPFHWFVQKINNYLAGHYNINGIDLFVSRGVGTIGPQMRLLAPADIAVINLRSK